MGRFRLTVSLALFLAALAAGLSGCDSEEEPAVQIEEIEIGSGAEVERNMWLTVHYEGRLLSGTVFDRSTDGDGQPLTFQHGTRMIAGSTYKVMAGFDEGVQGMRVGGRRKVTIPPELGYGARGWNDASGNVVIPPNSTLEFEIELLNATAGSSQ